MYASTASFAAAPSRMQPGRRLRSRPSGRAATPIARPIPVIANAQVRGSELLDAVLFLGEALGLPALHTTEERTAKVINLEAIRSLAL